MKKKKEITFTSKSEEAPFVLPAYVCERFLEIPEGFFDNCLKNNPITPIDVRKAIRDHISIEYSDMSTIMNYLGKLLGPYLFKNSKNSFTN